MTNTKLNYNGIWKQNVSTSENALKKHHFCEWTHYLNMEFRCKIMDNKRKLQTIWNLKIK